jgi:hypothetical protein
MILWAGIPLTVGVLVMAGYFKIPLLYLPLMCMAGIILEVHN